MTIRFTRVRNELSRLTSSEQIRMHCDSLLTDARNEMVRATNRAIEAKNILLALHAILPITVSSDCDLIGQLELDVEREQASRMLSQLRCAGYAFGPARYAYKGKNADGVEEVYVTRTVTSTELMPLTPKPCELAVNRLSVRWVAPYKGGSKCEIIEKTTEPHTYRTLVCKI